MKDQIQKLIRKIEFLSRTRKDFHNVVVDCSDVDIVMRDNRSPYCQPSLNIRIIKDRLELRYRIYVKNKPVSITETFSGSHDAYYIVLRFLLSSKWLGGYQVLLKNLKKEGWSR